MNYPAVLQTHYLMAMLKMRKMLPQSILWKPKPQMFLTAYCLSPMTPMPYIIHMKLTASNINTDIRARSDPAHTNSYTFWHHQKQQTNQSTLFHSEHSL